MNEENNKIIKVFIGMYENFYDVDLKMDLEILNSKNEYNKCKFYIDVIELLKEGMGIFDILNAGSIIEEDLFLKRNFNYGIMDFINLYFDLKKEINKL